MEIFYEQMADGYPVDNEFAIFVFHGVYDVPLKGKDKESLWESEEVYDFIICTISPMREKYEPAEPVFGFLAELESEIPVCKINFRFSISLASGAKI